MNEFISSPVGPKSLVERAKAILLKPAAEWPIVAAEPATPAGLITGYAVPLAAIGPVCRFLHGQLFGYGYGWFGVSWRPSLIAAISNALVSYVLNLVGIIVLALIADFLAPKFDGVGNRTAAFKLVVYGSTAAWLAGVFSLLPGLGILGIVGLYSFYLYYTGAAPLMQVPQAKAVGYTAVTVVCAIVLYIVVGAVATPFMMLFGGGPGVVTGSVLGSPAVVGGAVLGNGAGKLTLPGGAALDTDKLQQANQQIQDAASGKKAAVAPDKLQALLPGSIGSYQRTATQSSAAGGMGSEADGTYTSGADSFTLKVTDMAAIGALAGIGAAMGVQENREDADGYEKTATVDGQMQTEEWHKGSSSGKYGVLVDNRFMIDAEGKAGSIDDLKAAVATINQGALTSLAS